MSRHQGKCEHLLYPHHRELEELPAEVQDFIRSGEAGKLDVRQRDPDCEPPTPWYY